MLKEIFGSKGQEGQDRQEVLKENFQNAYQIF
jgi:hypothetical protein